MNNLNISPSPYREVLKRVTCYINKDSNWVHGWLDDKSSDIIAKLLMFQNVNAIQGAVGEIGVHHGKLFIIMALASGGLSNLFAIDIFEHQDMNVDRSGRGDRQIFFNNLRQNGLDPNTITVFVGNSLEISGAELREKVGAVRALSIDGGHTVDCIVNDLKIADDALEAKGLVIIDDVFNSTWPSVVTGFANYINSSPQILPFAASPNKVYGCRPSQVEFYRSNLRKLFPKNYDRSDLFFGHPIDTYGMWPMVMSKPSVNQRIVRKAKKFLHLL